MTPTQAITAAEALLLEGLCDNRVDWLTWGPDGTPPWLSWPLLSLPTGGARSGACRTAAATL
jgi:hypothetical protein